MTYHVEKDNLIFLEDQTKVFGMTLPVVEVRKDNLYFLDTKRLYNFPIYLRSFSCFITFLK